MRILLTGFEPFGGESVNPSVEVVRAIATDPPAGVEVTTLILEVRPGVWRDALVPTFVDGDYDAWLGLGQAGARTALSVERVGLNVLVERDGEDASAIERPIVEGGPAGYFARLPVHDLVRHVSAADVAALVSNHAGTYICNEALYGFQHHLEQTGGDVPSGFIHLPYLPEQARSKPRRTPSMPLETQIAGVRAAVEFVRGLVD
ncbi:MAG: pyroglutamyl-peptidase I [Dehalococcoidia bacterium]